MQKIISILFLLFSTTALAQSTLLTLFKTNTSNNAIYHWNLSKKDDSFQLDSTFPIFILVTVDYMLGSGKPSDVTNIICNGKQYTLPPGHALDCALPPNGILLIQDKNFKYGASGTYESIPYD